MSRTYAPALAILAGLLLVSFAAAADPVRVSPVPPPPPATWNELRAAPGQLLGLTTPAAARWVLVDDSAAALLVQPDGKSAVFASGTPGRYRLVVFGAADAEPARVVVVVGDAPPPPPKPPDPPPEDPLRAKFRAAYNADPGDAAKKDAARKDLAELFRQGAMLTADQTVGTTGELVDRLRRAAQTLAADALPGTRKAVALELAAAMPADEPLTPDRRKDAAALFSRISDALGW